MPDIDPPSRLGGWPDSSSDRDMRSGRRRPRHDDGAADDGRYYGYGDGRSAQPLYRSDPAGTGPQPDPSGNGPFPGASGAAARHGADPGATPPGRPPRHGDGGPGVPAPGSDLAPRAAAPFGELPPLELNLDEDSRTARSREDRREEAKEMKKSRAGRNLPAAIGVGVLLAGIVLGSLFLWKPAFVAVLAVASIIGVWEMVHAIGDGHDEAPQTSSHRRRTGLVRARPSLVPLIGGCLVMPALAWLGGIESLILGLLITVLAVLVWRLSVGPQGFARDMAASTLIAVYVPFLLSFGVLLAVPDDGRLRVLTVLALVVLSDTGGYAAGVFLGKHPMAPSVSPKKSWEGLGGSLFATAVGGSILVGTLLHQPWWHGAIIGLGVSAAAVLGDLAESMIKRDLGVKDMSKLLPGHGGLMDRLDSVVFAAPAGYMLMLLLAPVALH